MSKSYQVVKADNSSITNKVFINNTFSHYIKVTKNNNFAIFLVDDNSSLNNNSIVMTQLQRTYFKIELNDTVSIEAYNKELTEHKEITFIIERKTNKNKIVIDEKMYNSIKLDLMHIPIIKGMKYYSNNLIFTSALEDDYIKIIDEDTIINFIVVCENVIVEFNNNETKSIFKSEFNFKELGIGGLDKQFEVIFRRAFASRAIPNKICKDLGINHVRGILLYGVPGCGKCLAKDTPIIMYDGTIKLVQDIEVGDILMGDDSQPRHVLSLARGREQMYEIEQNCGDNYQINESHILSLKMSSMKHVGKKRKLIKASYFDINKFKYINKYYNPNDYGGIENTKLIAKEYLNSLNINSKVDIELKKYLELPESYKQKLKGYKVGVEFTEKKLPIDPYFLGLWLGDGTSDRPEITTIEPEILEYLKNTFSDYNINPKKLDPIRYSIVTKNKGYANSNHVLNFLKDNNLIKNKHIPTDYKINSRYNRLKLLAGLIDTDGYYRAGCYYITQKSDKLTNDIIFLARSLGFRATNNKVKKSCFYNDEKKEGIYNSIIISGNYINEIPCLLERKKANTTPNKDQLCNAIKIKKLDVDDYYGFEIDGNRRFLLGDFTVTHNTLIARQIGKILNCEEPKIVNGPSLLSKFHGESEENVRKLFEDAIADTYNSKLHLIICDEFDALARKRGSGGTSDLNDKIVNQFLTMIDGPKSLNNILLICMTNRKDLLDDAIMRPGRLEVQIEVSLPDEKGRFDILTIHTDKMLKNGYTSNLNLEEIAKLSINFTGAEIESIIKNAVSYSISRELDVSNLANAKNIKPQITQEDLIRSFKEIKPLFGSLSNEIGIITSKEFELYSDNYKYVYDDITNIIKQNKKGKIVSFLIHGDFFVGKTTLACNIMKDSNISCIKFINSEKLVNSYLKDQTIYEIFDSGHKSETLGIILDSVEKIIEYSKLGHQYNNKILQVIYTILDKVIENNKSVYIILTSSNSELMDILDFTKICHNSYELLDEYEISKHFRENI